MEYIHRDLEKKIKELAEDYSCILITGPRQVGKTTLFKKLMDENRTVVSLDDLEERKLAQTDPAMFLQMHDLPILIDEVQYAPQLFPYIKMAIDNGASASSFWLTGSQAFRMMELAQESLAGRTAIIHMSSLSQHELYGAGDNIEFSVDLETLKQRSKNGTKAELSELYERIWMGSMPGYRSGRYKDRNVFYSSYIQTYIDRDVSELITNVDKLVFMDFVRAAACRCAQMLNIHDIANDVGVSDETIKRWLQVLEKSDIIFYLRPYSNNLLKLLNYISLIRAWLHILQNIQLQKYLKMGRLMEQYWKIMLFPRYGRHTKMKRMNVLCGITEIKTVMKLIW